LPKSGKIIGSRRCTVTRINWCTISYDRCYLNHCEVDGKPQAIPAGKKRGAVFTIVGLAGM
jgi:hypothetical protein